ncbi:DUF2889 domain-containing protein [soil metagenome]
MPLSIPKSRKPAHERTVTLRGYRREDGLFEVDAELVDSKPEAWHSPERGVLPADVPVHRMLARLTVDDDFVVREIEACMDNYPFPECSAAVPPVDKLVGASLLGGWRKAIEAALGNTRGCSHIRELLTVMATAVYQTTSDHRRRLAEASPVTLASPPAHFDKCIAWDIDGPVVARLRPEFHGWRPAGKD